MPSQTDWFTFTVTLYFNFMAQVCNQSTAIWQASADLSYTSVLAEPNISKVGYKLWPFELIYFEKYVGKCILSSCATMPPPRKTTDKESDIS